MIPDVEQLKEISSQATGYVEALPNEDTLPEFGSFLEASFVEALCFASGNGSAMTWIYVAIELAVAGSFMASSSGSTF